MYILIYAITKTITIFNGKLEEDAKVGGEEAVLNVVACKNLEHFVIFHAHTQTYTEGGYREDLPVIIIVTWLLLLLLLLLENQQVFNQRNNHGYGSLFTFRYL